MIKELLQINNYVDGINDVPFFSSENPIILTEYDFNANRMGSISVSATFRHKEQLDNLWDGTQYIVVRGHMCFVKNVPTSSKDNKDERYKYQIEFISKRSMLDTVYFFDVVTGDTSTDRYKSNSTKVVFFGDLNEFVSRANYSLKYSNVNYSVVIDNDITTDEKQFNFDNMYMSEALQNAFSVWNIPYYYVGNVIHFGYSESTLQIPIAYGFNRELLSITKSNVQSAIINRCSGIGSTDNIPYYYPNDSDDRSKGWITPSPNLMPPIYRSSGGAERFYNAKNNTYPMGDGYMVFENTYNGNNPKEYIQEFPEIRPTITGVLNKIGVRIDEIVDFAYDSDDNDKVDETSGEYEHPYFYAKLRQTDGDFGFNLFDQAIQGNSPMTISMKTGNCAACNFEIGVIEKTIEGKEVFQNPVQVDENGMIVEGTYADKVKPDNIQPEQQDTSKGEVWVALKKDDRSFGVVMPNNLNDYKPSPFDKFVLLYIQLPKAYILAAEDRLEDAILDFMLKNNSSKFDFSINFSRVYFSEHPDVLKGINENSILLIQYNNNKYELYVSSFSYKARNNSPLPEISVELTNTLTIRKDSIQQAIDKAQGSQYGGGGYGGGNLDDGNINYDKKYLRKDKPDWTKYPIGFYGGATFGTFVGGLLGSGAKIDKDGRIEAQSLTLREFLEVPELRFNRIDVVSGELWNAVAFGLVESVDTANQIVTLKLEEGELSGLHVNDFCRGIFHNLTDNDTTGEIDSAGFEKMVGFSTSYFMPVEIIDNNHFKYELKPDTTVHPCASMKFAVYGNAVDKSRQASAYSTRTYKRYLVNVDNWVITTENISIQEGDLTNLTFNGQSLAGGSIYLSSVYFGSNIEFIPGLDNPFKGDDAYNAVLSSYAVTYKRGSAYPKTTLQITKGTTKLTSSKVASKGHYVAIFTKENCEYTFDESTGIISITKILKDNAKILIHVNCEGVADYDLQYEITRVSDGINGDDSYSVVLSSYSATHKSGEALPSTKLYVNKGNKALAYNPTPSEGYYFADIVAEGCTFNHNTATGEITILSLSSSIARLSIVVNCENKMTYELKYSITDVEDGYNGSDSYSVVLSSYAGTYTTQDNLPKTSLNVSRGDTRLRYDSRSVPPSNAYSLDITANGCTYYFDYVNEEIEIRSTSQENATLSLRVNCEGKSIYDVKYYINKVKNGESSSMAILSTNSMSYKNIPPYPKTKVRAFKGSSALKYSGSSAGEGEFSILVISPKLNCDARVVGSYPNSAEIEVFDITDDHCEITINVDIEGKVTQELVFNAEKVSDGEKGDDGYSNLQAFRVVPEGDPRPSAPSDWSYPPSGYWSQDPPTSQGDLYMSKAKFDSNNNRVGSWSTPVKINGRKGSDGNSSMLVNRGIFQDNDNRQYQGNEKVRDVVGVVEGIGSNKKITYYIAKKDAGFFYGSDFPPFNGSSKWEKFQGEFESIASGLAFFNKASIAGWWFEDLYIYSQNGNVMLNGNADGYSKFAAGIPSGSGDIRVRAEKAKTRIYDNGKILTSDIEASGGKIGQFTIRTDYGEYIESGNYNNDKGDYILISKDRIQSRYYEDYQGGNYFGYFSLTSNWLRWKDNGEAIVEPILKIEANHQSYVRNLAIESIGENIFKGSFLEAGLVRADAARVRNIPIEKGNKFFMYGASSIKLPILKSIEDTLLINNEEEFAIRITVITGSYAMTINRQDLCEMYDENGSTVSSFNIKPHTSKDIILMGVDRTKPNPLGGIGSYRAMLM